MQDFRIFRAFRYLSHSSVHIRRKFEERVCAHAVFRITYIGKHAGDFPADAADTLTLLIHIVQFVQGAVDIALKNMGGHIENQFRRTDTERVYNLIVSDFALTVGNAHIRK